MRKLSLIIVSLFLLTRSYACPFCGCGGGNLYMGLLPDFKSVFISIRYHYSQYHTTLLSDPTQFSDNYYNIAELYSGVNLGKKFQILGFIPYYQNKQVDDDGTTTPHGLGDITLLGQYKLFGTTTPLRAHRFFEQQLWIGAGLKLPTGSFNVNVNDPNTTVADINAQLGTGSTDFLINTLYSARIQNFGINASVNYKMNGINRSDYKYGNRFTGNLIGYYRISGRTTAISPNLGVDYENIAGNLLHSSKVRYTGSQQTNAIIGVEINVRKIGFGINAQLPVIQNFAEGQTRLKFKSMAHITVAL